MIVKGGCGRRIAGCDIHDLGASGVALAGGLIDARHGTYRPGRHEIHNCHVHHLGIEEKSSGGISLRGCGNVARRNLVHDVPRTGIGFKGTDHRIEGNIIRHVMTETSDGAGIGGNHRNHIPRGTRIRYNLIHDVLGFGRKWQTGRWRSPHFTFGIYLDDYTNGVEITYNIVLGTDRSSVFIHDGRDNTVENNILAHGLDEVYALRKQNWWREFSFTGTHQEGMQNNAFRRNICLLSPETDTPYKIMPTPKEHRCRLLGVRRRVQ